MTPVLEKAFRVSGVPEKLLSLFALSHDLRWTWRADVRSLFEELDAEAWKRVRGNPVRLLRELPAERLRNAADDPAFQAKLAAVVGRLSDEDLAEPRHPGARELVARGERVAYFSAEFGLTEILPIYAGGLGVLAGDHLKSASDLGVPLVGVGLFYREGYFRQVVDAEGKQNEAIPRSIPRTCRSPSPRRPTEACRWFRFISPGETSTSSSVWRRSAACRCCSSTPTCPRTSLPIERSPRASTEAASEMRLQQEIVLGIGGSRALAKVGLWPTIRHINEGHAAFVSLEKIRQAVQEEHLTFAEAREVATSGNIFTTHTPVPAGIDVFTPELLWKYFGGYVNELGISFDEFFDLGREVGDRPRELFSMAVLAMRLSTHQNAVSRLHADVSRRLWRGVAPDLPLSEIPIRPITNGVHAPTWTAPEIAATGVAENPEEVDRAALWSAHESSRARLVAACREMLAEQRRRLGASDEEVEKARHALDPKALTIGFARRFATYKRATLLFCDQPKRLERLLHRSDGRCSSSSPARPTPRQAGQGAPSRGRQCRRAPEFAGPLVFLEDYDMAHGAAARAGVRRLAQHSASARSRPAAPPG